MQVPDTSEVKKYQSMKKVLDKFGKIIKGYKFTVNGHEDFKL